MNTFIRKYLPSYSVIVLSKHVGNLAANLATAGSNYNRHQSPAARGRTTQEAGGC